MPYQTADAMPTDFVCRLLRIPNQIHFIEIVNGALSELIKARNFELLGAVTPDEMADKFQTMFFEYLEGVPCMLGSIIPYATSTAPDGTLECDGMSHLRVDYPNLYAALDSVYIVDADTFVTPDLRGRSVVGVGVGTGLTMRNIGDTGGVEVHALDVTELPAHSHTNTPHTHTDLGHFHGYTYPTINLDLEGAGVPDIFGAGNPPIPLATTVSNANLTSDGIVIGDTGDNTPHENMHPFHALRYCIVAR